MLPASMPSGSESNVSEGDISEESMQMYPMSYPSINENIVVSSQSINSTKKIKDDDGDISKMEEES